MGSSHKLLNSHSCSRGHSALDEGLEVDADDPHLLLAHHFLQYNAARLLEILEASRAVRELAFEQSVSTSDAALKAVLSGGAYLGEMVSQKLCVPHGAPGVRFYQFEGVQPGKEPARVQEYLKSFDQLEIDQDTRNKMLKAMKRIYADTEAMMTQIFDMNPASGVSYKSSKEASEAGGVEPPAPCNEQLTLSVQELRGMPAVAGGLVRIRNQRPSKSTQSGLSGFRA